MSAILEVSRMLTASFKMFRRSEDECGPFVLNWKSGTARPTLSVNTVAPTAE